MPGGDNEQGYYRTDEEVIDALIQAKGIISDAAQILDLKSPNSLRSRVNRNPELKKVALEARQVIRDLLKSKWLKAVEEDKEWAIVLGLRAYLPEEFGNKTQININANVTSYDFDKLPLEERLKMLENFELAKVEDGSEYENSTGSFCLPE